jgi:hypothetical protein
MQRKAKVVLSLLGLVLLVLLVLGGIASASAGRMTQASMARAFVKDPGTVDAIGHGIVAFDLPAGYGPQFGMRLLGAAVAAYTSAEGNSHLILVQVPRWLAWNEAQFAHTIRDAFATEASDAADEAILIEERELQVGDSVILYAIHENINGEDVPYRSLEVLFPGRNGPVFLFFQEPLSTWDDARTRRLLASLR